MSASAIHPVESFEKETFKIIVVREALREQGGIVGIWTIFM